MEFQFNNNLQRVKGNKLAQKSHIEWTHSTWNPVTGCNKVSEGCRHCYAERMAYRLREMGQPNYRHGFTVQMHDHVLEKPLHWKTPQTIFVNSMSDLFHPDVTDDFIQKVFAVMREAKQHRFQVLTKRSERLAEMDAVIDWPENVWMGVSVENWQVVERIDHRRSTHAHIRFLSIEPLLGPLHNLNLDRIHWVIVGGESGPKARPMQEEWVLDIKQQCKDAKVPFFFKQWGGVNKKKAGRLLEGSTWDAMPV